MTIFLLLLIAFLIIQPTLAAAGQGNVIKGDSAYIETPSVLNDPSLQGSLLARPRWLQLNDDQQLRQKQNEEAFKSLREGLNNMPEKPRGRQRFSKGPEGSDLVNHLNQQSHAHAEQVDRKSPQIDNEELFKEAGLIELEDIREDLQPKQSQKDKDSISSQLQVAFYLIISILITVYLIKCIKQRCFDRKERIASHHEEAESLSQL